MNTKKLPLVHPGETLREEFMKPFGLSANTLARALGVTSGRINEIANEKRGITVDTALRLAKFFKTDAQSWINLQVNYELDSARRVLGDVLKQIHPHAGSPRCK